MLKTSLNELLDIRYPVLSAPMANVSGGALASAVSTAGGLGLVGGGYGDAAWLRRELDACNGARIGVGFITWSLARNTALLDLALSYAPVAVMFSFGDFTPYLNDVRAAGAKVICQVQTEDDARRAADAGADIIVAQGTEAGGHGGSRGTFALVPAVVDMVSPLPVLAAGGIADGRGLAASLMLGASGALVGTRFFASAEALGHRAAKQALVDGRGDDTLRTRVFDIIRGFFWPDHFTARALTNRFAEVWHGREATLFRDIENQREDYFRAVESGDVDTAVVFAGEAVSLVDAIEPAADILDRMVSDAARLLGRA